MKYFFLLLFCMILNNAFGQQPKHREYDGEPRGLFDKKQETATYDIKPQKGDAQIVIKTGLSLIEMAKKIMNAGYTIEKMDTTLGFITTQPTKVPGDLSEYYLSVSKYKDGYQLSGMYRMNMTLTLYNISSTLGPYEIARFHKAKSHRETKIFNAVYDMAIQLGEILIYLK